MVFRQPFKDFDSTGRVYEQYTKKWINHLRSAVPEQSPLVYTLKESIFGMFL